MTRIILGEMIKDSLEKIKEAARKRGVKPCQALFATFLAGLTEAGILNQATVNLFARSAAPKIYAYLEALGYLPPRVGEPLDDLIKLSKTIYEIFEIGGGFEYRILEDGKVIEIGFGGDGCGYCPRGVGLADIPWTACPFPRLYEQLVKIHGVKARLEKQITENGSMRLVVRRGGKCWFRFRLG